MNTQSIITWFLSANLLFCVVALYYRLFLSRQRRFHLNRAFLLGGMGISLLLPLLRVASSGSDWAGTGVIRTLPEVLISANGPTQTGTESFSWLPLGYLTVVLVLGALLLYRIGNLLWQIAVASKERKSGYTLVYSKSSTGPASFFHFLFWDKSLDQDEEGARVILAHERCHIRQWHSLDLLWMELLLVFCWFNPAVYLLRRDLRCCHEYLADEAAAREGGKHALFRQVLARQLGSPDFTLANHFQSQIKARITMLNLKSGHKALVRYLMILPLVGLMFACTSIDDHEASSSEGDSVSANEVSLPPPRDYDSLLTAVADEEEGEDDISELEFGSETTAIESRKADGDPDMNEYVMLDKEPKPLNMNEIAEAIGYPAAAKEAEITGKLIVRVKVGKDGSVEDHAVIKDPHPILRKAVEAKLYDLKFEPGVKDGKKVKAWVTIPFKFEL